MIILWAVLFIICFLNFTITGFYYGSLPESIPLILKLTGEPVIVSDRSVFTAFRMPLMTLIICTVCCIMWHNVRENIRQAAKSGVLSGYNDFFWGMLASVSVLKMSAEWLPFAAGIHPRMLMIIISAASAAAAVLFLYFAVKIYRSAGPAEIKRISSFASQHHRLAVFFLLSAYFLTVVLPVIFR